MPKKRRATSALVSDFESSLRQLVAAAKSEGRAGALADVRGLVSGDGAKAAGNTRGSHRSRGPGAAQRTAKESARKNPWADLTPQQRLKRVNAIRKGRGLKPKRSL